jgi:hypothetical protein
VAERSSRRLLPTRPILGSILGRAGPAAMLSSTRAITAASILPGIWPTVAASCRQWGCRLQSPIAVEAGCRDGLIAPAKSTKSIQRGLPTSSPASQIIRPQGFMSCCPGTGIASTLNLSPPKHRHPAIFGRWLPSSARRFTQATRPVARSTKVRFSPSVVAKLPDRNRPNSVTTDHMIGMTGIWHIREEPVSVEKVA